MITFNKPPLSGNEQQYVLQAMQSNKISGDGFFGKKCQTWFEEKLGCPKPALFTRALIERSEGTGCWHCLSGFASSARVAVE